MTNQNLRALFTAGPTTRLSAEEIFTDRIPELEAFQESFPAFQRWTPPKDLSPVTDVTEPRTNVLTYYGIGGIGKTALSRHLEELLLKWVFTQPAPRRTAIRIDFDDTTSFDLETLVLRLRAGLGDLTAKWPAFDLAFNVYWERAHPGEPLKQFISNNSALRRIAQKVGLSNHMENSLSDVAQAIDLPSSALQVGHGVAKAIYRQVSSAITSRRLFNRCPFFKPLIEADANDDTLSYLPSLLAWELENLQAKESTLVVIFLDTFEAITNRTTRDLERFAQRLVFLMPNVLFVITGRNRLDWAELIPPNELDYVGVLKWPHLSVKNRTTEPRQHLIGFLSPVDCDEYLRLALSRDGVPLIEEQIRARITGASAGLPLYLDLSVAYYCDLLASNQTPTVDNFGGPLASVVTRIMRDMDAPQRILLRGASLLDSFDEELLSIAGGGLPDAAVADFVTRPFVQRTVDESWPYTLHALLREAIRKIDDQLRDGWSGREWNNGAQRVCMYLGELSGQLQSTNDRPRLVACFLQGVRLASEFDLLPEWIAGAGNRLADMGVWSALDLPSFGTAEEGSIASALRAGFRGIALRRMGSLGDSITQLEVALASPSLTTEALELFVLHQAHSVRNSGSYDQAEEIYRSIFREGGRFKTQAQVQLADIELLRGRFQSALEILGELPSDSFMRGEAFRIKGHIYRVNGLFAEAESSYRQTIEQASRINSLALEGKGLTNLAETYCWRRPDEALVLADRAIEFNATIGNRLELVKAYAAKAIAEHSTDAVSRADASVDASLELVTTTGYRAGAIFALVARAFQLIVAHRAEEALELVRRIESIARDIAVYHFWVEIVGWWLEAAGFAQTEEQEPAQWLEGRNQARSLWCNILAERG